jgi:hypothetical protein
MLALWFVAVFAVGCEVAPSNISVPTSARAASPSPISLPTPVRTSAPPSTPAPTPSARPIIGALGAGTRISWQGRPFYLHGANVPWLNFACDFGCGAKGGVSSASVKSSLSAKFAQAAGAGIHTIRWWVFEGDAWQIERDAASKPTGVNPAVYVDFDAALALAAQYDLYYDFVLFSGPTHIPATWQTDPTQRQALGTVLGPLFARYKNNSHVLSWEVYNEPDLDILTPDFYRAVSETTKMIAESVHANTGAYVTVGLWSIDGLLLFTGLGLDYFQIHWYDPMGATNCAICTDYSTLRTQYKLDGPLVVGELYLGVDTPGRLETLYGEGYAGAWAWSLFPDQTTDRLVIDMTQAAGFGRAHQDLGPRRSP